MDSDHVISMRKGKGSIQDSYRLQIGSIELCNDIRKLGFWIHKTHGLAIPFIPDRFLADFVRGYFDGDGNIWHGQKGEGGAKRRYALLLAFTSCSRRFLTHLQDRLADMLGVTGSLFRTKKASYRLQFSTSDSLKIYSFMYNGLTSTLFLGRKRAVFENYITHAAVAQR